MRLKTLILLIILGFLVPSAVSLRRPFEWHPSIDLTSNSIQNPRKIISSSTAIFNQLHAPIKIINDSDFRTQADEENWPGDGSFQHPYVIEGLQITGAINLIEIYNTSVYFQISSCSLTHGRVGISLYHVTNGFLFNNTIFECLEMGIFLQSSGNCTFANNSITANGFGLYMTSCSDNLIQYNFISANGQRGIFSTDLTNCTIFSNHITHNSNGIFMEFFHGIQILDNLIENNHNEGIRIQRNEILSRHWNGHEYRLIPSYKTWAEAKLDCEARGGHLVTITSSAENTLVTGLTHMGSVWIGLTDEITEGEFQWVTGEAVDYTNWAPGEPNDAGGEDYTELYDSGEWNDIPSGQSHPYVCEWENYVTSDVPLNTVISGNQVINNTEGGIYTNEVQNIQISDNLIINSSSLGLELRYSSFCNITHNQAIGGGIRFDMSGSNRIVNNSVKRHGFKIDGWEPAHFVQITVVNNSVNGKPFIYWQNISDQVILEAGQVFLMECNNITIRNQNISFTSSGIKGYDCTNVTVTNNIFHNNSEYAVWFRNSADCMISDNEMRYNGRDGLSIDYNGLDFSIINNTIEGSSWDGIFLSNSERTVLMKNTIRNNRWGGVSHYSSYNSHIQNNTFSNNGGVGIRVYYSNLCNLINNTITNNMETGIHLYDSHYNSLIDNSVINNSEQGINLDHSRDNIVQDNVLVNNTFIITGEEFEHFIQTEIINNTINSKSIVYWLNMNEGTVPSGAGLVILVNSNSVTVGNQNLVGIIGAFCSNVFIQNNLISNGSYGIYLRRSYDCHIFNNTITNIRGMGIDLWDTPNNIIINNTISKNEGGLNLESSQGNFLTNNTIIKNTRDGIRLWNSGSSFLISNTVVNNGGTGIRLEDSSYSILNANSVINNSGEGIYIDHSGFNSILNNLLVNNSFSITGYDSGHYYQIECVNNSLNNKPIVYWLYMTERTVPSGAAYVILVDCDSVTVVNQNVYGILGVNCLNLTIRSNIISNGSQGIQLRESSESLISGNIITNVSGTGIEISYSTGCILTNNIIENGRGIKFLGSGGSSLINNTIENSSDIGVYLSDSHGTTLTNNTVSGNDEGIYLWYSRNSILSNNQITHNERTGIRLLWSEYCTLSGNFIFCSWSLFTEKFFPRVSSTPNRTSKRAIKASKESIKKGIL